MKKNIEQLVNNKLLNRMRGYLVKEAECLNVTLRHNYNQAAQQLESKVARYEHAK